MFPSYPKSEFPREREIESAGEPEPVKPDDLSGTSNEFPDLASEVVSKTVRQFLAGESGEVSVSDLSESAVREVIAEDVAEHEVQNSLNEIERRIVETSAARKGAEN